MGALSKWMTTEDMEWESVKKGERGEQTLRMVPCRAPASKRWAEKKLVKGQQDCKTGGNKTMEEKRLGKGIHYVKL